MNEYEVQIKLGLDKSVEVLDKQIGEIEQKLQQRMENVNKSFEKSIKGKNLSSQEKFNAKYDYANNNYNNSKYVQNLEKKKISLTQQRQNAVQMSKDIDSIGQGKESLPKIEDYIKSRIDFIKGLDSLVKKYGEEIESFKAIVDKGAMQDFVEAAGTKGKTRASTKVTSQEPTPKSTTQKVRELSSKADKMQGEKQARVDTYYKKIKEQAKSSGMSDTDFNKIKDKILSDLMIQVENEFQSGRKTVSGGKSGRTVYGYQSGGKVDQTKGQLASKYFGSFITEDGKYVSGVDSEGKSRKTVIVDDARLANPKNIGGVGDLRNSSLTGLEKAFDSLMKKAVSLEESGKGDSKEYGLIKSFLSDIFSSIKDSYENTSSDEIKELLKNSLISTKSMKEIEAVRSEKGYIPNRDSALSNLLRTGLKLEGEVTKMQPNEYGWSDETANNKTDQTSEKEIQKAAEREADSKIAERKEQDEAWNAIKNSREDIKNSLLEFNGASDELTQAVLALAEGILNATGLDIDREKGMSEVVPKGSLDRSVSEGSKTTFGDLVNAEDYAEPVITNYNAEWEARRRRMAGGLGPEFQKIQGAISAFQGSKNELATDDSVPQVTERLNWLADIVEEINQPELATALKKIAQGYPTWAGMDSDTVGNSISKIVSYPETLKASLKAGHQRFNEARVKNGLEPVDYSNYENNFFANNPEIKAKYETSLAAKNRFDNAEGDISDKIQAFFQIESSVEDGINQTIVNLNKAYDNLDLEISRVATIQETITDKSGKEQTVDSIKTVKKTGKEWVNSIVDYRTDTTGFKIDPNKGINRAYYESTGAAPEEVNWGELELNPTPALKTALSYKGGLTGSLYGGKNNSENIDILKSLLESKQVELEQIKSLFENADNEEDKKSLLNQLAEVQSEIDFYTEDLNKLILLETNPVTYKNKGKKKNTTTNTTEKKEDPTKQLKEKVRASGLSVGSSFSAKNSKRGEFSGTIQNISGQGQNQVVEALLNSGETVRYTFEGLLNQLVSYSDKASQEVVSSVEEAQKATEKVDNSTEVIKPEETASLKSNTADWQNHSSAVEDATEAEQKKYIISEKLASQLKDEENATEDLNSALEDHSKLTERGSVSYTYKDLQSYDDATHTYTDISGNKLRSITQLGGALKGFVPSATAIADEKAFMAAIANTPKGEQLTAEKIGMTAQDFAKKKNAVVSREKGNLEHEVFDLLSKTGFSGIEGFAGKDVEVKWNGATEVVDAQEQFARVLKEKAELLSKLGIDNAEQLLLQAVESYTKAINNAHIQLTPFSETPMAASFSGPKGTFDYSFTPDQIARSSDGSPQNFILDTKTGKTYGTESFQLAGQLYGVLANAQNPAFQKLYQESGIDTDKDFSLFIADVKDGFTQLIQHMALTEEEFYDLLVRANDIIDGNAEPLTKDEQAILMNREMTTGRVFGRSEPPTSEKPANNNFISYAPDENGNIDKREQSVIGSYLAEYQKLVNYQTQLNNLKKQQEELAKNGVGYTSEESQKLEQQISTMQATVNLQKKIMTEKNLDYKVLNAPREANKIAIGDILLSDKGSELASLQHGKINALGNSRQRKNDTSITTTQNTEATKDLDLLLSQYKELLSLQNQLKESNIKAESLTGDKQTAQQTESANLQKRIEELQQISNLTGEITDEKRIEDEITKATYLTESERVKKLNTLRTTVGEANQKSLNIDTKYAQAARNNNPTLQNTLTGYYRNLEEQGRIEREIARAQNKGMSLTGNAAIENKSFIHSLQSQKNNLANQYKYDEQKKTLNGIELTEEQINKLEQERTRILNNNQIEMDRVGDSVNQTKGFLTQLKDNFKDSFSQIGMAIMQIFSFQQIQKVFNDFISATERLDQKMVDLQIASGYTKSNIHDMMLEFNDLAKEIGKTTEEIAEAANDWLRAGYEGQEVSQLTNASMQLSTLGMINSADATSYLISVLKGWKLEATEIQGVVDKLTAVDMQAAISAGDLAEAMSRASNSAQMAGTSLDRYIAYLTTITDVTQKSAASVGESMKTVYARYQNIAAGKFVAAESDIESENYNADEWANLNDVEKALGALGINIRDSVSSFRDFDDIMDEIASKWNTYTDVQKSGIATSLAGVRQRENLLTLFENWDAVEKFEEISTNAYGTAIEKMKSYTDSVEAAKNRITVALEKWVLALNQSDTLIWFYNAVAEVSDNLVAWAGAILLATAAMNSVGFGSAMQNAWSKFVSSCINVSMKLDKMDISTQGYFTQGGRQSLGESLKANYTESFNVALKENYAKSLTNTINSLDNLTDSTKKILVDGYVPMQNSMLNYNDKIKANIASILKNTEVTDAQAALQLQENLADQNNAWVDAMLSTIDQEELRLRTEQITQGQRSLTNEEKLQIATEELARRRNDAAVRTIADDLEGASRTSPQRAALKGGATMVGSGLGALAGMTIGENLLGGGWATSLGTMIGMGIGGKATSTMALAFADSMAAGGSIFTAMGASAAALGPVLGLGVAALAIGAGYALYKKHQQKMIEEAKAAFTDAADELTNAKSLQATAQKYDELSKGVDSLGRNVSLTDEEYEKFLDYSNQLVEAFPELRVRTDENGNAIADMGNEMETTSDKVKRLIDSLQTLADQRMVMGSDGERVLQDTLDTAAQEYKDAQTELNKVRNDKGNQTNVESLKKQRDEAQKNLNKARANNTSDKEIQQLQKDLTEARKKEASYKQMYENGVSGSGDLYRMATGQRQKLEKEYNLKTGTSDVTTLENQVADLDIKIKEAEAANAAGASAIDAAEGTFNRVVESTKQTLSESGKAYARLMGAYDDIDDVTSDLLDSAIAAIDVVDSEGNALSPDAYKQRVRSMISAVNDFVDDKTFTALLDATNEKVTDEMTVGDATEAREKLRQYLEDAFPDVEDIDENSMKIIIGLGFKVVDGEIVDDDNILQKFKEDFGISDQNGDKISLQNLTQIEVKDARQIYEWLKDGTLEITDDMMTAVKLLQSARSMPTGNWEAMDNYMVNQTSNYSGLEDKARSFFKSGDYKTKRSALEFSDYTPEVRAAIDNITQALNDGVYEIDSDAFDEAINSMMSSGLANLMSWGSEYAEAWKNLYYPEDMDVEGHISTFKELQTALKETAQCYEDLADAQEEQATNGKLSLSTILDLLTTNSNYINLLDFEKEKLVDAAGNEYEHIKAIKLKKNAAEEMAASQLLAAQASAMLTIQELTESKATMMARAEAVQKTLADREGTTAAYGNAAGEYANAQAKNDVAQETVQTTQVMAKYAGILGGILNILDSVASGEFKGVAAAYRQGKAEVEQAIGDISTKVTDYASKITQNKTDAEAWMKVYSNFSNEELQTELKSLQGQYGPDGQWISGQIDNTQKQIDVWKYFYQNLDVSDFKGAGDWLKQEKFIDNAKNAGKTAKDTKDKVLDLLKAYDSLIDKEWEAMKVFDEDTLTPTGYTKYFEKKRASLEKLAAYYEGMMQNTNLTEEERLDAEKNYIENQKAINNLDDEEVEDKYKILELYGASINSLILMKQQLVKTSDTYEELLENQKDLNSLLQDEIDLRKEVSEWQQKLSDRELDYVKGSAWSNSSAYDAAMNASLAEIEKQIEAVKASMQFNFSQAVYGYMTEGMSEAEARAYVALGNSEYSKRYREDQQNYLDLIDKQVEYTVNRTSAQIEELSNKLQLLEDSKPQEWTRISDIESYYASRSALLQSQIEVYQKALEDVSDLTDDQIKDLVDGLNEATVALHEAKINAVEDKIDLQEKQYDAIVYRINLYKDELQDAIDAIEQAYEDEIKPLERANQERERALELENLLLAKKNANKQKDRVYRQGLGWVFESNPTKLREAQKDLDDFYKQDRLDDLNNTKDAEQQILQDRIDAWDKYLEQLEWDYKEYERLENERILKELMNANSEEEIRARITADMEKFNSNAQQNYKNYTTIFQDNLLTPYRQANEQLAELRRQRLDLLDTSDFYNKNNNPNGYYDEDDLNTYDFSDLDMNTDYAAKMLAARDENEFKKWAAYRDEKARRMGITLDGNGYGYDGAGNKFRYQSNDELYQQWLSGQGRNNSSNSTPNRVTSSSSNSSNSSNRNNSNSNSSGSNKNTSTIVKPSQGGSASSSSWGGSDIGTAMLNAKTSDEFWRLADQRTAKLKQAKAAGQDISKWPTNQQLYDQWLKLHPNTNKSGFTVTPYATGIEEGPVTYTGLAMLHGTPSKPEYVLNSDQTYNLLRNMATTRLPEMERTGTDNNCGTQYIVQGDVVLEGVNDPAKFWSGVTTAMGSRWNVTRKTRG